MTTSTITKTDALIQIAQTVLRARQGKPEIYGDINRTVDEMNTSLRIGASWNECEAAKTEIARRYNLLGE